MVSHIAAHTVVADPNDFFWLTTLLPQVNLVDDGNTTDAAENNDEADSFIDNGTYYGLRGGNRAIGRNGNDDAGDHDSYDDDKAPYTYSNDD